jgi:membrane glycosyltransferase
MSETTNGFEPVRDASAMSLTTPAGLQANATLNRRRILVLVLNVATWSGLLMWAASVLSAGGWTFVDCIVFCCFVLGTPWPVLGFWNAVIGLWLLHGAKDPMAEVAPFMAAGDARDSLVVKTAVLMTLRNEDPGRAILRLRTVKASLDATSEGAAFSYFLLSDSNESEVAAAEEAAVAAWRGEDLEAAQIVYRRRADNTGFKAGNVRDFCESHGRAFDFMLPLDADSLMTGEAIVKLVRMMQA